MKFISNADVQMATQILEWVQVFLVDANPMMKRSPQSDGEPICPFAKACLSANTIYFSFHHEVNGKSTEQIEDILLDCRDPFKREPPYDPKQRLTKALLVVFPEIPSSEGEVLDLVHDNIKTQFVRDGLMVTQCYPRSDGRSVHNPALRVYTSPYSLMAVRHMALHDVLFVEEDEAWFAAYDQRFGIRFREPEQLQDYEKPLLNIYRRAKERFVR
jgi:hypothetical protein